VTVKDLRTPFGPVGYSLRNEGGSLVLQMAEGSPLPPGGFVLVWPGRRPPPRDVRVNGKPAQWHGSELRFHELPARIVAGPE
jgi:hypothetical protein